MPDHLCPICDLRFTTLERYYQHERACLSNYSRDLKELTEYGVPIQSKGKVLHGCAMCGQGFEDPIQMGIHMVTECENGPKTPIDELLGRDGPSQTEIDDALASIATAVKETS